MKKITKLLAVTAILTMIFAMPVMAREVSFSAENTDYLISLLNNNTAKLRNELSTFVKFQAGPNADAVIAAQTALVENKIATVNKECAENHIACLTQKVNDAKADQKRAIDQLNGIKNIQGNVVTGDIIKAQGQVDAATADVAAKEAYLEAAKVKLAPYM
ncbi:MAG: hypothetical protein IKO16_01170 [Lachnospiraceae bacterium]|nr:hypothetical protein [Lachnospiraceae bacterium]